VTAVAALPTAQGNGPWRILVLDRDPDDPMWCLCLVSLASDVRPAVLDASGRTRDWEDIMHWVGARIGRPTSLVPIHDALCWRIDEGGTPR
jgi:hypothetical protein